MDDAMTFKHGAVELYLRSKMSDRKTALNGKVLCAARAIGGFY